MLKKLTLAISAAAVCGLSSHAAAEAFDSPIGEFDVSMTATLATDYIWRGQSQTEGSPAIQGSLDVAHESGLYAGIWASNVDGDLVNNDNGTGGASIEVDYYVGYAFDLTDEIGADIYYAAFDYPQASSWNSSEVGASVSGYGLTVGYKYGVDDSMHANYTYAGYDFALPYDVTMTVAYGYTDAKDGSDDYEDYTLAFSKTVLGVGVTVAYTDTSLSDAECTLATGKKDLCDGAVNVSLSKTF